MSQVQDMDGAEADIGRRSLRVEGRRLGGRQLLEEGKQERLDRLFSELSEERVHEVLARVLLDDSALICERVYGTLRARTPDAIHFLGV